MLDESRRQAILDKARTIPCVSAMRFRMLEFDDGFVRMVSPYDPAFDGTFPVYHGGMLAMVADCAAWFAIVTRLGPDAVMVTTDLTIRYLAACKGDVTATGRVIKIGRTLCPVTVEMFDPQGTQVAVSHVTYIRLST